MSGTVTELTLTRLAACICGRPEAVVVGLLEDLGAVFRLSSRDGEYFIGTRDFRKERFNLTIVKGMVTEVDFG